MAKNQQRTVHVKEGQFTPIPGSGFWVLPGPGKLVVTRYGDGKIGGLIVEGETCLKREAMERKLERISWGI